MPKPIRTTLATTMILSPLLGLVSALASAPLRNSTSAEVAEIARHPDRFYLYAFFITASMGLLAPAVVGLTGMVAERAPRLSVLGGGLALFGALVATGDATTELMYWQMGAPGADRGQMAALAHRYENAAGSSLIFALGGIATIAGLAILAGLLWRTQLAPALAAVGVPTGVLINIVGFSAHSNAAVIASNLVLLATLGWIGRLLLTRQDAQHRLAAQPAPTTT